MASMEPRRHITGVVVSAGKMINTVKVRIPKQVWNRRVQKVSRTSVVISPASYAYGLTILDHDALHSNLQQFYSEPKTLMVSDPTNSTREGDVVALEGGRRISRHVRHVVAGVIAPMGPPMKDRTPIPSAVERLAAVEGRRAAKDIRQAARGRWPAIVRVRERESKGAAGAGVVEEVPAISLEQFVKVVRKRKGDAAVDRKQLVLDFIRVAGYRVLEGELPLHAQRAALHDAKGKLAKQTSNLEETLMRGTNNRTDAPLSLSEREQLSKKKLEFTQQVGQLERSMVHFSTYMKELDSRGKRELRQNVVEWFDVVRALSLNAWEQNVAALDLFGRNAVETAVELDIEDVLTRHGLASAMPATPLPTDARSPAGDATNESALDESAIRVSATEEQALTTEESHATTEAEDQAFIEDAGLAAQRAEAEAIASGEKELELPGQESGTGPQTEHDRERIEAAQEFLAEEVKEAKDDAEEKAVEAEVGRRADEAEAIEVQKEVPDEIETPAPQEPEAPTPKSFFGSLFGGKK